MDNQSTTFWSKQEEEIWQDIFKGGELFKCFLKEFLMVVVLRHWGGMGMSGSKREKWKKLKQGSSPERKLRNEDCEEVVCWVEEPLTILGKIQKVDEKDNFKK